VEYLCRANPEFLQNGSCFVELDRGALTLHRQQLTFRPQQRQCPPRESLEWRDSPGGDHIGGILADDVLGTRPPHGHVGEIQQRDALLQKNRTPQERLQQGDGDVRAHDREHDAGQPSAGTDIDHIRLSRDEFREYRAVEDMPVPQTLDLAWTDEAAFHTRAGKELGIPLGDGERVTEDVMSDRRRRK
jgi:hypothetical protein